MSISVRPMLREFLAKEPFVLGWMRRIYVGLGFGEKNENDYLFDIAQTEKDIFVLQVGANDGKRHDSLSPFMLKYPWRGVLLEPLPDIFAALRDNYAKRDNVTLLNAALADRDGEMAFYRVQPGPGIPDNCHELGSFYREVVVKHASAFPGIEQYVVEEMITAVSFPTLVRQQGIQKIDVVVIDTEGYDFEILKMVDFRQFRPRLVIYEHMHLSKEDQKSAAQMLVEMGYTVRPLIKGGNANTVAVYDGSKSAS